MRRSRAVMGAAAFAAALSLTGCGTPDFVYGYCQSELTSTLAQAAIDGLNTVSTQCGHTFTAISQINMCIAEGAGILSDAKTKTMNQVVDQCANYVVETVCSAGSHCHGHPDKMTPAQAQPAVEAYVHTNKETLTLRMKAILDSKIADIVSKKYEDKYRNRAVPTTVQAQCSNDIQLKLGEANILTKPTLRIFEVCTNKGGSPNDVRNCQDWALRKLHNIQVKRTQDLKKTCAEAALAAVCPRGSPCAIETWNADTTRTAQEAVNYLWSNFQTWLRNLEAALMSAADQAQPGYYRLWEPFALPAWQGSSLLTFVTIGAVVVGGLGFVVAGVRCAHKRSTRSLARSLSRSQDTTTGEAEMMLTGEATGEAVKATGAEEFDA